MRMLIASAALAAAASSSPSGAAPFSQTFDLNYTATWDGRIPGGAEYFTSLLVAPVGDASKVSKVIASFEGTLDRSLSASNNLTGGEYCLSTFAQPTFSTDFGGDFSTNATAEGLLGFCSAAGEGGSDEESESITFSKTIEQGEEGFDNLFDDFPLTFVFSDPNIWDLQDTFESVLYVTGFTGTLTISAVTDEVPEPAAIGLFGIAALAAAAAQRRRAATA